MQKPTILLLTAVVVSGILHAQTPAPPASSPSPAKDQGAQRDLPVPGGGAMLDHPAPTQEEALKTAKQNADAIADLQARRIAQQLSLTSAQFLKVRTILMGRQEELRKALGADSSDPNAQPKTPQERQQRIQEAQQETQRKIAAILTPDQKKQFDAMQARGKATLAPLCDCGIVPAPCHRGPGAYDDAQSGNGSGGCRNSGCGAVPSCSGKPARASAIEVGSEAGSG